MSFYLNIFCKSLKVTQRLIHPSMVVAHGQLSEQFVVQRRRKKTVFFPNKHNTKLLLLILRNYKKHAGN